MRIVAIIATYNEELFIRSCIETFIAQGVEVYLIDNNSTDRTVEIAESYRKKGLIGLERFPREGVYRWEPILRRKEEIADEILADWYIHADPDEIRLPPPAFRSLADAVQSVDRDGWNAINFKNFLFLPTLEHPDHERPDFAKTMLWYRYMEPSYPNQIKGWKRQKSWSISERVALRAREILRLKAPQRKATRAPSISLAQTGGHKVDFPGQRLCPNDFIMKHYQVLSLRHAVQKYVEKDYALEETQRGWHGWKAIAKQNNLRLPSEKEMVRFLSDAELDSSNPIKRTLIFQE